MILRTNSEAVFACHSKACAPPPAGTGGSLGGKGKAFAERAQKFLDHNQTMYHQGSQRVPSRIGVEVDPVHGSVRATTRAYTIQHGNVEIDVSRSGGKTSAKVREYDETKGLGRTIPASKYGPKVASMAKILTKYMDEAVNG